VLALDPARERGRPARVVGSHVVGGLAGLAAWWSIAGGATLTAATPALSPAGLRLAASATASVAATSWGMIATDAVHAPACATTLIASLGLLSAPIEVGVITASVTTLVGLHVGVVRGLERLADAAGARRSTEE
jgi:hypothetical protein